MTPCDKCREAMSPEHQLWGMCLSCDIGTCLVPTAQ